MNPAMEYGHDPFQESAMIDDLLRHGVFLRIQVGFDFAATDASDWTSVTEWMTALASVGGVLTALVAFYLSYQAYRASTRVSNREHRHATSLSSLEILRDFQSELWKVWNQVLEKNAFIVGERESYRESSNGTVYIVGARSAIEAERKSLEEKFLNQLEMLALAINGTAVDIGFANDFLGRFIEHAKPNRIFLVISCSYSRIASAGRTSQALSPS